MLRRTPKVSKALHLWLTYPLEIEHDLEVYRNRSIGEWLNGTMSSRKLLMYLDGLVTTTEGWYTRSVRRDYQQMVDEEAARNERFLRAENKAQLTGAPLDMADL